MKNDAMIEVSLGRLESATVMYTSDHCTFRTKKAIGNSASRIVKDCWLSLLGIGP